MATLTHTLTTTVSIDQSLVTQYGEEAVTELMLAAVIADTDCPNGLGAGWALDASSPSRYENGRFHVQMAANVALENGYDLRASIDTESSLFENVEGFESVSDEAFDAIVSAIRCDNDEVKRLANCA